MPAACRRCKKPLSESLGPLGPFCSERCRLLDLGKWADGTYRLAGESVPDEEPLDEGEGEHGEPSKTKTIH